MYLTSFNRYFGTQNLLPQTTTVGEQLFADQSVFTQIITSNEIFTQYTVTRKNGSIHPLDYTVVDGKLTFNIAGDYTVTMTNEAIVTDMEYPAKVIVDITVSESSGIEETRSASAGIQVYPNPTTGIVNIGQQAEIKVYSLQGALLQETFGTQVNLSSYPQGIYQLQINGETVKVVKK